MSLLQGGRFEHRLMAAFFSSMGMGGAGMVKNLGAAGYMLLGAAIGGTAESLGGGKFANGAVTGAFIGLLNDAMHNPQNEAAKHALSNDQKTELENKIMQVNRSQRIATAHEIKTGIHSTATSVSMDVNGVTPGIIYAVDDVSIWIGKENLTADVIYAPNSNGSEVNMVTQPHVDYTIGGRIRFENTQNRGMVVEIYFKNKTDYNKYWSFIQYHDRQ